MAFGITSRELLGSLGYEDELSNEEERDKLSLRRVCSFDPFRLGTTQEPSSKRSAFRSQAHGIVAA